MTDSPAKTVRQALLDAADHIEMVGLNQDGGYVNSEDYLDKCLPVEECRKCTLGAFGFTVGILTNEGRRDGMHPRPVPKPNVSLTAYIDGMTALGAVVSKLSGGADRGITGWNDNPNTTQGEVVSTLRKAAELVTA